LIPDGTAGNGQFDWNDVPAAGASEDIVDWSVTLPAMDGSDTISVLYIDTTNADHTGSGNNLNALAVDAITGDDQADENLFFLGDGFDYFINDEVDTALGTLTWTTNADKTGNGKSGTLKVFINNTLYHIQLYADS
jgi:hypothetical protein